MQSKSSVCTVMVLSPTFDWIVFLQVPNLKKIDGGKCLTTPLRPAARRSAFFPVSKKKMQNFPKSDLISDSIEHEKRSYKNVQTMV